MEYNLIKLTRLVLGNIIMYSQSRRNIYIYWKYVWTFNLWKHLFKHSKRQIKLSLISFWNDKTLTWYHGVSDKLSAFLNIRTTPKLPFLGKPFFLTPHHNSKLDFYSRNKIKNWESLFIIHVTFLHMPIKIKNVKISWILMRNPKFHLPRR